MNQNALKPFLSLGCTNFSLEWKCGKQFFKYRYVRVIHWFLLYLLYKKWVRLKSCWADQLTYDIKVSWKRLNSITVELSRDPHRLSIVGMKITMVTSTETIFGFTIPCSYMSSMIICESCLIDFHWQWRSHHTMLLHTIPNGFGIVLQHLAAKYKVLCL